MFFVMYVLFPYFLPLTVNKVYQIPAGSQFNLLQDRTKRVNGINRWAFQSPWRQFCTCSYLYLARLYTTIIIIIVPVHTCTWLVCTSPLSSLLYLYSVHTCTWLVCTPPLSSLLYLFILVPGSFVHHHYHHYCSCSTCNYIIDFSGRCSRALSTQWLSG